MKLAVVSPGYPPDLGGVETVVEQTSEALVRSGVVVEVWTQSREVGLASTETINGVVVRRFPSTRSARFPISQRLARHVRTHANAFDVLHLHNYHALPAASGLLVPRDRPLVFSPHFHGDGHTLGAQLAHRPYGLIGGKLLSRADHIVAVSAAERDLLVDRFPGIASKTEVIHNGTDSAMIERAQPRPNEPPTLLVLGRLEPYKHVDEVIAAMRHLPDPSQLVIIGDGPDRFRLTELARPLGDRVRLLGRLDRADVCRWLKTAHAVVSLSGHEAFGVVALEAASAGALAIVSDISAHREVATIAPPGSILIVKPDELQSALSLALARTNAGYSPVRSWTEVAADYAEVYAAVLSGLGAHHLARLKLLSPNLYPRNSWDGNTIPPR